MSTQDIQMTLAFFAIMTYEDVDGVYGEQTIQAVKNFQVAAQVPTIGYGYANRPTVGVGLSLWELEIRAVFLWFDSYNTKGRSTNGVWGCPTPQPPPPIL